ncbi:hypothetical protein [Vibrio nigripulchritudo]|uniref:hypothetical protein n=1 Tax=Vibrio nigripulchritudo TaxID=28173 RepID=UPI002490C423|nr:hypothetical protein [Vibrio nigripulchritudo]BDU42884.1 hypothetical protein TUMSATVNIG3_16820 [Vibrio nigripulchritudo]
MIGRDYSASVAQTKLPFNASSVKYDFDLSGLFDYKVKIEVVGEQIACITFDIFEISKENGGVDLYVWNDGRVDGREYVASLPSTLVPVFRLWEKEGRFK